MSDRGGFEDDRLRAAFAALADEAPTAACPDPDRIWEAANGQASPDETAAIVDHLASCGACAEAWRLAMALPPTDVSSRGEDTRTSDVEAPRREAPLAGSVDQLSARRRRARYLAAAGATLALAAGIALYVGISRPSSKATWRQPAGQEVELLVPDGAALDRGDFVLRWSSAGPGARYSVTLTTDGLETLASAADLDATMLSVPAASLAALAPGTPLVWRVEATLPDGTRLQSPTRKVTIR